MCGMPSESNATEVVPPGTPMAMIASGVRFSTGLVGDGVAVTVAVDDCVGVALGAWVAVRVCVGFVVWVLVGAACVLVNGGRRPGGGVARGSAVAVRGCVGFVVWVLVGAACVLVNVGATAVAVLVGAAAVAVAGAIRCGGVAH